MTSNKNFISGYASVFDVCDSYGDIIKKGAFARTVDALALGKSIPILWQHMVDKPIGAVEKMGEDPYGLYVVAKILPEVHYGREALELIKSRVICGLSIGYNPTKHSMEYSVNGARIIEEIELWEVSIVTFPANHYSIVNMVY